MRSVMNPLDVASKGLSSILRQLKVASVLAECNGRDGMTVPFRDERGREQAERARRGMQGWTRGPPRRINQVSQ